MPNNLDPSKVYLVSGKTLTKINDRIDRVTAGDNIQTGPGIFRRGSGKDGYTLASPAGGPTRPVGSSAPPQPFQMLSMVPVGGDITGASGYYLTLQPGSINGNIFPQVGGTYMWQQVGPPYAYPTLIVHKGDQIYIQGDVAAGVLVDANIYSGSSLPSDNDSTTTFVLGTVGSATGAWTQVWTGDLAYSAAVAYWNGGSNNYIHSWSGI